MWFPFESPTAKRPYPKVQNRESDISTVLRESFVRTSAMKNGGNIDAKAFIEK